MEDEKKPKNYKIKDGVVISCRYGHLSGEIPEKIAKELLKNEKYKKLIK